MKIMNNVISPVLATTPLTQEHAQEQTDTQHTKSKKKKKDNTQQQSSQKSFAEILDKELKR